MPGLNLEPEKHPLGEQAKYQEGAALLADRGWAVIPLAERGKKPLIKKWPERATKDPAQIAQWWEQWPKANIGVACGPSGLVVIDLDVKNGANGVEAWEWLCAQLDIPPWDAPMVETPSGGRHLYYSAPEGVTVRNSTARLGPGIDVRGDGGYVVAPPSITDQGSYVRRQGGSPVPLPEKIVDLLVKRPGTESPSQAPSAPQESRNLNAYVEKAVSDELAKVAGAPEGSRNDTLNRAAFALGQLVKAPWANLDQAYVENELLQAARACRLPDDEARKTIASGLKAGMANPRERPKSDCKRRRASEPITSAEYIEVLSELGYSFKMDVRNDRIVVNEEPITDALAAKIRVQMRDLGYTNIAAIQDAYTAEAYSHPWHPVQEYLDGLKWDGADHITKLASYFEDERGVFKLFLTRWLIGAVAKVYEAAQNRMLILDGKQNLGKSHFVRWLCSPRPHLLVEGPINPESKDDLLRLTSYWIWEVAELGSTMRKADRESLKHFLTRRQVTVRRPYGQYDMVKPAMASFIGTVNNESGVLSDPTGSRRFMVVHLLRIDHNYTEVDVNQVWAQAVVLYRAGEPWELQGQERELAQEANEDYEIEEPLVAYFHRCYVVTGNPKDRVPTVDILKRLRNAGWRGLPTERAEAMKLASVLRGLGLKQYRTSKERGWSGLAPYGCVPAAHNLPCPAH